VYSLLEETQNIMTIVGRAVPWSLQAENREKACERFLLSGVLTPNPKRGQAQKAW